MADTDAAASPERLRAAAEQLASALATSTAPDELVVVASR